MSHTNLLLGRNWPVGEWPDYVAVGHEGAGDGMDYAPKRTCHPMVADNGVGAWGATAQSADTGSQDHTATAMFLNTWRQGATSCRTTARSAERGWRLTMPTDNERREVARKLRGIDMDEFSSYGEEFDALYTAIGLYDGEGYKIGDWPERLADLIEPPMQCPYYDNGRHWCGIHDAPAIDRAALLALADEMEGCFICSVDGRRRVTAAMAADVIRGYANRIRDALGVASL